MDSIDHDIHQLDQLTILLSEFDRNQNLLENKIMNISKFYNNLPYIVSDNTIIYQIKLKILTPLNLVISSFNNFKRIYIDKNIRDIRFNIYTLGSFKQKLNEIKSSLDSIKTIVDYITNKETLSEKLGERLISLNVTDSVETLLKSMKTINRLSEVYKGLHSLKTSITKEKNKLFKYLSSLETSQTILPDQINNYRNLKNDLEKIQHNFPNVRNQIKYIDERIESINKLINYYNMIKPLLSKLNDKVEFIIASIDDLRLVIEDANDKLRISKSKLDKRKYIELLLDLLKLESTDNIKGITTFITNNRKSILPNILKAIPLYRPIIIQLIIFNNLIKKVEEIDVFKELKQNLIIINKLKLTGEYIRQLESISSAVETNNINVKIEKVRIAIKGIQEVLSEIKLDNLSKIVNVINILEHVKNSIVRRRLHEYFKCFYRNLQSLLKIISILKLIKILVENIKCFKEKLDYKLKCYENDINKLECAIEGVSRNFIRCSILCLTAHLNHN